ncbi:glycoside hydrolase family 127 protein [Faecalicatena contorta]|uniref:Glycoside hydrolase family 127 protein n=1 Tax=Faecalicatena contorta TaxID=39482 RepID=A0A316A1Y1_9FIRM|nr:beta-L-arabinofuranosidase domain-containing protein [Faecalicatena contorta]PWJ50714.1 hypothetical protein A8805_1034 [Faecalicatena contorta]SUQ13282.1 hypothetical protein SAMN05216529_1034 [Faecalicatena contorta]
MLKEIGLEKVTVKSEFWNYYIRNIKEKSIPFQYKVLDNDASVKIENENKIGTFDDERSNALENLRIAAGISEGERYGTIFQDSDVYKWLEAVAYSLYTAPDKELQALAESLVDLIEKAQDEDGYIDTYFQVQEPKLRYRMIYYSHEMYCMGHLLEAAVAYHQVTGNQKILKVADKILDNLDQNFGYEDGKIKGADGHQEVEIGLLKYYELTGSKKALSLVEFLLDIRGQDPDFYKKELERNEREGLPIKYSKVPSDLYYMQAYAQPKNQRTAQGHAVRMLYMAAAMARLVVHNQDREIYEACKAIWRNIVDRKLYVTAGVGSTVHGEAFSGDYDLPNDTMYCETCASIALVYFAYEMYKFEPKVEYIDVIERALYNGILSGASIDGTHFFYVNPTEVHGAICDTNPGQGHVLYNRPQWYSCACCPPNFARTIGSVQRYFYTVDEAAQVVYGNLFAASEITCFDDQLSIVQQTSFPKQNEVSYEVKGNGKEYELRIRIPYWASNVKLELNQKVIHVPAEDGYVSFKREWQEDRLTLTFDTAVMSIRANARVIADANRLTVQKGPFVYCAEGVDNPYPLTAYRISAAAVKAAKTIGTTKDLSAVKELGIKALRIPAKVEEGGEGALYQFDTTVTFKEEELTLIPYYAWANRGTKDMMVWFHQYS